MKKLFVKLFKDQQILNIYIRAKDVSKQQCPPLTPTDTSVNALFSMQQRILDRLEDQQ